MKFKYMPLGLKRMLAGIILLLTVTTVYITCAMAGAFDGQAGIDELRSVYAAKGND